jgi:hypothetical protein
MKVFVALSLRVVLGVLAATLGLLAMSGCGGGGWGGSKPTVSIPQGQAETVIAGQSATFTVTAAGVGPFTYQWYLNGTAISTTTVGAGVLQNPHLLERRSPSIAIPYFQSSARKWSIPLARTGSWPEGAFERG